MNYKELSKIYDYRKPAEAKAEAKRRNSSLTKGEKSYYGLKYKAVSKDKLKYL